MVSFLIVPFVLVKEGLFPRNDAQPYWWKIVKQEDYSIQTYIVNLSVFNFHLAKTILIHLSRRLTSFTLFFKVNSSRLIILWPGEQLDILFEGGKMKKKCCPPPKHFRGRGQKNVYYTQTIKNTNVTNRIFSKSTHLIWNKKEIYSEMGTFEWDILNPDRIINLEIKNEWRTSNI